jgi:Putative transposase, YhgA-like
MTDKNLNPHDDFFKIAFSRQDVVEDYIKQFLSSELVQNLDFQTLKISNNSYTTQELSTYFADVVWECTCGQ